MKKRRGLRYLNKQWKKMEREFNQFLKEQKPEALHQFRIAVKKIRSFLTLLESGNNNHKLFKTFKPVKKIFRQTGIIRDAQMHQQQAADNHMGTRALAEEHSTEQEQATQQLLSQSRKLQHRMKTTQRKLKNRLHEVSHDDIQKFFISQINGTKQLLNNKDYSEKLHDGRKMLKHVLYNQHLISKTTKKRLHINFAQVNTMQQAIGDWHDNKLAIEFFSQKLANETLDPLKQKQTALKQQIEKLNCNFQR